MGEKWNHDSECLRLCQRRKSKFIEQAPARQRALDKIKRESKYSAETTAIELISIYQASSEGCKLTKLTKAQSEYLGIGAEGPFKPDNYRY